MKLLGISTAGCMDSMMIARLIKQIMSYQFLLLFQKGVVRKSLTILTS